MAWRAPLLALKPPRTLRVRSEPAGLYECFEVGIAGCGVEVTGQDGWGSDEVVGEAAEPLPGSCVRKLAGAPRSTLLSKTRPSGKVPW
jgi:hypothetical protein